MGDQAYTFSAGRPVLKGQDINNMKRKSQAQNEGF
jgi:Fe-S cluster assembly ATPase SufC